MGEKSPYSVRIATDNDRQDIIRLVSEMHGTDATRRFDWFYRENPHGDAISWVAVDDVTGRIDAVTSVFPRHVLVDSKRRLGSIGGDAYVAPQARRQGLATRLHLACREYMGTGDVEFMYGVPLVNNLRALVRAGSAEVTLYKRYVRPLSSEFVVAEVLSITPARLRRIVPTDLVGLLGRLMIRVLNRSSQRRVGAFTIVEAKRFGREWDEWFEDHSPSKGICCVRDSDYLNFVYTDETRKNQTPYFVRCDGALFGMFVLERSSDRVNAVIVDLMVELDAASVRTILSLAVGKAADTGCISLTLNMTPYYDTPTWLRAEGFFERPSSSEVFQVLSTKDDDRSGALEVTNGWYFLHRDQDL